MNIKTIIIIEKEEMRMLHGGQGGSGSPNGVWEWDEDVQEWRWVENTR